MLIKRQTELIIEIYLMIGLYLIVAILLTLFQMKRHIYNLIRKTDGGHFYIWKMYTEERSLSSRWS